MYNTNYPDNNQNYIVNQPIYINNNNQNNYYISQQNSNEYSSIIPKSFDCIYSNLPLHQPQYVQKEIEINYKYRRYIPILFTIGCFGEFTSTLLFFFNEDLKKLNSIINGIVSIILMILLIILFKLSYKITIIFNINEKIIKFQENTICINLKQEVKNFNEVFIIRINKNNHQNSFKIAVMNIERDITTLDINGIGRCYICNNSKDSFYDIDCFIFKCNSILEKCHGLTKTFSSLNNNKDSNNLIKVPYLKY